MRLALKGEITKDRAQALFNVNKKDGDAIRQDTNTLQCHSEGRWHVCREAEFATSRGSKPRHRKVNLLTVNGKKKGVAPFSRRGATLFFTQVSEVTKPPPVGADPYVCPTPKGVPQMLNRWKYVVPTLGGHMGPPLQSGGYGTTET